MAKLLKSLIRRTLLSGEANLVSVDDPYDVIRRLLAGRRMSNILDAGANHGRVARHLARPFPEAQVHLFEPNTDYAADLKALAESDPRFRS